VALTNVTNSNQSSVEWSAARTIINDLDERITDIRKYGLTIVSALLTAQGLIEIPSSSTSSAVPISVKFAILTVSLVLVMALCLLEKSERLVLISAAARARVLERKLSFSLTEDITFVLNQSWSKRYPSGIYSVFIWTTVGLGFGVLDPSLSGWNWWAIALVIAGVGTTLAMLALERYDDDQLIDFGLDRYTCKAGETVTVTFTNLTDKFIGFNRGQVVWKISNSDQDPRWSTPHEVYCCSNRPPVPPGGTREWTWETTGVEPGLYTLWYSNDVWVMERIKKDSKMDDLVSSQSDLIPLPRQIRVTRG
jgi:hypothetical protein